MPAQPNARPDNARAAAALAIALLHLVALGLLLTPTPTPRRDPVLERVLALVAIPAPTAPAPAQFVPPTPHDPVVVSAAAPVVTIARDEPRNTPSVAPNVSVTGGGCAVDRLVAEALDRDADARSAIDSLSPHTRAATGAVMLWNGAWANAPDVQDAVRLARLRPIVIAAIKRAPADCLTADVVGPRLIAVADAARTTMFVIGSGRWHWGDLRARTGDAAGIATPREPWFQPDVAG